MLGTVLRGRKYFNFDGTKDKNIARSLHLYQDVVLGEGGHGKVIKGQVGDSLVAVKYGSSLIQVCQEKQILRMMNHPNIVKLVSYDGRPDDKFIVMEFAGNMTLIEWCESSHNREVSRSHVIHDLIGAISYMHALGIIHGDLKPENIAINDHSQIKVLDMGLSSMSTSVRGFVGTKQYMAPEVLIHRDSPSMSSDMWSFGVIVFALTFQKLPFECADLSCIPFLIAMSKQKLDFHRFSLLSTDMNERLLAQKRSLKVP